MRIGVFADAHDHIDNVRRAVVEFNRRECRLVIFAGDFVSPLVIPPLRRLQCPVVASLGDNDGNVIGIRGGMRVVGDLGDPPFGIQTADGTRILVTHILDQLRGQLDGAHAVISAHSHRPSIARDAAGRLFLNPGETSGWTSRQPTIAILETEPLDAEIIRLPELPPLPEEWLQTVTG